MTKDKGQKADFYEGFSTGIKLWLFFLISFVLLEYSVYISIFLGAVAGFSGAFIMSWWKSPERDIDRSHVQSKKFREKAPSNKGIFEAQRRRAAREKRTFQGFLESFGLFNKQDNE
ncbi:hypothetical protein [Oscillatoria salina]|uniref:hypothetical protein n=1 Tax=Oscillatoria salina TaxID=331517 RepID=UPI0013BC9221|nr:hypothetical protein [Oscillatoria salina]MBZ8179294.1 hypothetical protein [Oscillatoria salina IIICB1]NET86738.1 hypothetical protein [Kamptonema sp. SIO1D9]